MSIHRKTLSSSGVVDEEERGELRGCMDELLCSIERLEGEIGKVSKDRVERTFSVIDEEIGRICRLYRVDIEHLLCEYGEEDE